jgi:molybdopterin molybdotransferase
MPHYNAPKSLKAIARADVLITSGGVSMGTRDYIKPLLAELGTVQFGRIAFKPGKPTMCATVGSRIMFGLPGNPVSSLVSFEVFVRQHCVACKATPASSPAGTSTPRHAHHPSPIAQNTNEQSWLGTMDN